ncbi:MAG: beta-propeller domain-containing protein [Chloroflexota bacterium]|nr:beta-propeller domain-containing protein [Chloroflexota bacterium]
MKSRILVNLEKVVICLVIVSAIVVGLTVYLVPPDPISHAGTTPIEPDIVAPSAPAHPLGPLQVPFDLGGGQMVKFKSYEELKEYVGTHYIYPYYYDVDGGSVLVFRANSADNLGAAPGGTWEEALDYSETNIQVEGVDEADTVKTDGKYIYIILQDMVIVVDAYPTDDARILCEIELEGNLLGMYVMGDTLVILENRFHETISSKYKTSDQRTHVKAYDVSDRENPVLAQEVAVDGRYWNSRMVGDYIYVITNKSACCIEDEVDLPKVYLDDTTLEISAQDILHPDEDENAYNFTVLLSFNVRQEVETVDYLGYGALVLGTASNLYVSQDNIYITRSCYSIDGNYGEATQIHRISFDDGVMEYKATGEVPGRLLNQFSLDEHDTYLRVATTTGHVWQSGDAMSGNHLYVLDDDLEIVGELKDLAPGERIYSARFMGNRCYLVTFRKVDPLFVIDLSDPSSPEVLGELKITGYSDYLHPYDENHLIGIGKETVADDSDTFSWYQGVKISLFDVTDVNNPKEIAKYEIGDRGTDSIALGDHKAVLFDRARNLLVIPVSVAEKTNANDGPAWQHGSHTWQGAYVFHISPEDGLILKGRITHQDDNNASNQYSWYYSTPGDITRSLYIGDVLYTISESKIKMHDIDSLDYINEVELPEVEVPAAINPYQR